MKKNKIELLKEYYEKVFLKTFCHAEEAPKFNELSEMQIRSLSESIGFIGWQIDKARHNTIDILKEKMNEFNWLIKILK